MFKKVLVILVLSAFLAVTAIAGDAKKMKFIVTSPDAQTNMMAMVLSMQTKQKGADVSILLCGPGGDLGLKDSKETVFLPIKKSPQMLLKALIKGGVKVEVCPLYLPAKGLQADALIEGINVAKPPVIAGEMVEPTTEVITF